MNMFLIGEYVRRMTRNDINNFAISQGIVLKDLEIEVLYNTIKNDYKKIALGDSKDILDDLKAKIEPISYDKIEALYNSFKDKLS